jgi:hypothetical protein
VYLNQPHLPLCPSVDQKEYAVDDFAPEGEHSLEFVDSDGSPFNPSGPVKYSIVDDEGSTLQEGTIDGSNIIPLNGVTAKTFQVIVDSHFIVEIEGMDEQQQADSPVEQIDDLVIPHSSDHPDEEFEIDENLEDVSPEETSEDDDKDDGSGTDGNTDQTNEGKESETGNESDNDDGKKEDDDTDDSSAAGTTDGDKSDDNDQSGPSGDDSGESQSQDDDTGETG